MKITNNNNNSNNDDETAKTHKKQKWNKPRWILFKFCHLSANMRSPASMSLLAIRYLFDLAKFIKLLAHEQIWFWLNCIMKILLTNVQIQLKFNQILNKSNSNMILEERNNTHIQIWFCSWILTKSYIIIGFNQNRIRVYKHMILFIDLTQSSIYNYLIQPKFGGKKIYDFGFTFQPLDQSVQSKILLMYTYAIIWFNQN